MGLKDLVAQKAALTEEAIERIVSKYVRYDTDEVEIAFTPEFAKLGNKAKILVYLVSLQGWQFVIDVAVATTAKPANLEAILGIPGGTLRPTLKDLKDRHLININAGAYSVRASHLASVESEIAGSSRSSPSPRKAKQDRGAKAEEGESAQPNTANRKKNVGLGDMITKWIADGFFDDGKTTGDVKDRFHEEAIIVPTSSIPGYVNKAVRVEKTLKRKKEDQNGKQVWVYRTNK